MLLGAPAVIVYFTVFPIPRPVRPAEPGPGPPLDQRGVAVADTFTKLGWNEHDCRAASRYSLGPKNCPSVKGRRISPGCVEYSAANGETIAYTMAKMPQGWRVVAVKAGRVG